MAKIPNIVSIADLRQDATSIVKRVARSREPVIITQRGRAAAVMLSVKSFERSQREREILYLLIKGEREIAADAGNDLEEVLAQVDATLASRNKGKIRFTNQALTQFQESLEGLTYSPKSFLLNLKKFLSSF